MTARNPYPENMDCCSLKAPISKCDKSKSMAQYSILNLRSSARRGLALFLLLRMEKMTAVIALAAILLTAGGVSAQNQYGGLIEQKFAMEPQDQTAIVGSRVTLPCRVIGKSGVLQWTKDDFGLGAHRNLSGYERYTMIGSDEEGDYSLDIFPVQLEDDAKYQCQVSPGPLGQAAIRSRFASITVLVPPEAPHILQGSLLQATEDQLVELECVSVGGKPAAEITWIDGEGAVLNARAKYSAQPSADGRRATARSVLRLVPKRAQHAGTLSCQAQNTADRTFRAAHIKLEVKYAPVVSVKILSGAASNGRIPEGAEVRLGCKAEANPNDLNYRWFLNDELVVGDYTTEMVIYNVSRKLHDSIVKCEVQNSVGKSEESETLDVTYGPRFRSPPTDVAADLGGTVTLSCDLDGNPPPAITWLHKDQDRWSVVGTTPNLTLTVDSATSGRYNCKASVHGFPEIEADAVVYLKGPPKIISPRSQLGMKGDNAKIECRVVSVPRPVHLMWSHGGREISPHTDPDISIHEDPLGDGVKSTLVIRDSQSAHYTTYNCSVTNEYGSDVVELQLVAQSFLVLSNMIMIVAVVTVLVLIMVFCAVIWKRCCRDSQGKDLDGKPDVMVDAEHKEKTSYISDRKHDLKMEQSCNPEYSGEDYRSGSPLAGSVPLPVGTCLRQPLPYSNDYSDHAFPANFDFKDGHNNNGYSSYVDFSPDYNHPPSLPLNVRSPSISGIDSHSNRLSLNYRSPSGGGDSLQRRTPADSDVYASGSLQRRAKADANSIGLPSITYDTVGLLQHPNGVLKQNGGSMLSQNGIDIHYAATYGNPFLRTTGLHTVNTANPAATPAPPPYNSLRNSTINMMPSGSSSYLPGSAAQPQATPQSPASKYIHSALQNPPQMVQLTKKSAGTQQSLATHV